jgi:hypothetical protein
VMTGRDRRMRENQELFRTGNERIGEVARSSGVQGEVLPFLCECASDSCLDRIELTISEYQDVRSGERQFVILPGHARAERERVLSDNGRFQIVRKEGS